MFAPKPNIAAQGHYHRLFIGLQYLRFSCLVLMIQRQRFFHCSCIPGAGATDVYFKPHARMPGPPAYPNPMIPFNSHLPEGVYSRCIPAIAVIPDIQVCTTITAGLYPYVKEDAARFSFLLSLPVVGSASWMLVRPWQRVPVVTTHGLIGCLVAFIISCLPWICARPSARENYGSLPLLGSGHL